MIHFEKYLIEKGWKTNDIGTYSSLGTIQKKYSKDGKDILIGLSEKDKPVTLIYPRPWVLKNREYVFVNDDIMNRILMKFSDDEILESLFNKQKVLAIYEKD